ncbi:putative subunit of proteaseome activator complex [Toxoplasma gondii GAB2-2007-GAL-DOM2]|uniref:Putative subunit of proteaseome activator complex n=7 Tax=Toxoplasma gondii TaxID=5811 RepID=S7WG14_TOXGG|nr:putative subunit of proteaseome activator complex [Toxoplasma gondii GT1]KAF4638852.1 putative subunit of proteaseome activator complex [Toxoplasma gondii]KFG34754.1 putative subunit of proteaseome activator complex [Toxoplasma gondii GAB2-2007-GAL-DOM2]KFG46376.1 putative subunit of proteaseome activator complex [Toxoplasma gondii FOU]KFH04736.1 putative subunit of proteaseome activator complex [Toxoplasma gondii MAS]PUA83838.1 putative subunit of proteaseome activator complex [Toxoplasma 
MASTSVLSSLAAAGLDKLDKLEPSDQSVKKEYEQFKKDLTRQAVISLKDRIPRKILHFNNLTNVNADPGSLFPSADMAQMSKGEGKHAESGDCDTSVTTSGSLPPGKRIKLDDGRMCYTHIMPRHGQICEQLEQLKRDAAELVETLGQVKLWIQLNVPRIEDGNNFGVGIQEEAIQELARVEDWAFNLYDAIFKYYMARAKLSTKVLKYPNVGDYWEAIRELDEKELLHIKFTKVDMRNNYSMLYDLLCKNWEKVVKPKNEDTRSRMTF